MNSSLENSESSTEPSRPVIHWWHWVAGILLVLVFTWLSPRGKSPEYAHLTKGSISQQKIIAPFDFEVLKFPETLEEERKEAAENVYPVLVRVDSIGDLHQRDIIEFGAKTHSIFSLLSDSVFQDLEEIKKEWRKNLGEDDSIKYRNGVDDLFSRFGFRITDDTWDFLFDLFIVDRTEQPGIYFKYFDNVLENLLRNIYGQGIINVPKNRIQHPSGKIMIQYQGEETAVKLSMLLTPNEAIDRISVLLNKNVPDTLYPTGAVSAAYEILQTFIAPNIIYDSAETERRKQTAIDKVPTAYGLVKKDELIIDKNIRVTREHLAKLNSLATVRAEREQVKGGFKAPLPLIGQFIIACLLISFLGIFIARSKSQVWDDWKLIILISLLLILIHVFQVFVPIKYNLSKYLFPIPVLAMLTAILVDRSVALIVVLGSALIGGFLYGNDFTVTFATVITGGVSVLAVRDVKNRADVMRATIYLAVTYIPLIAAFHFIRYSTDSGIWKDYVIAGGNAVISPVLVLGLLYIFENLFRITTDFSLLELSDLNRPLLRELSIKSPGTYHHSIMVGTLAEKAAQAINANSLLTRAGAYYHDIGKIKNKEYFIENQETGIENIHDKLPPSKSADIVIKHVEYGLELADKYKLPERIKDFIREHHGKSKLAFFYKKAISELGEEVDDKKFRYPGPNPRSKETGILMLADLVEAATRTMDYKNHDELSAVIEKLIRNRLLEGDLDDCPLTVNDLKKIKESFVQVVLGIHHQRIPYPGQREFQREAAQEAKDASGEKS